MQNAERIFSIDIMRGLTLFLMLFVNDLYTPGVPEWLTHKPADANGMGLADWVFPGFLFIVGMAVPFAIQNRLKKGDKTREIFVHVLIRTISLLTIGVLMLNTTRFNQELTGMNKNLWAVLVYISIFLVWNKYEKQSKTLIYFLKSIGFAGILVLVLVFRAGTPDKITWIETGWWGILGLIGWGYFVTSLVYLVLKDNLAGVGLVWLFFIFLNVLSQLQMLSFLNFAKPLFGVIIGGNIPSIVLAGLFFGLLLKKMGFVNPKKFIAAGLSLGIILLIAGFVLKQWFIVSKIQGTPSWATICSGISTLVFVFLFVIIDVFRLTKWAWIFKPAGNNSLTTYLAPDVLYFTTWFFGWPVFFYKQSESVLVIVAGSLLWSLLMIGFAALLSKIGIRLKL